MSKKNNGNSNKVIRVNGQSSGFVALLTIIVIAAMTLLVSLNASLLGLGELDLGYTSQKGGEVYAIADGCAEESLRRFRLDTSYTGGSITTKNGSCIIEIIATAPNATSTVTASTMSLYYKTVQVAFEYTNEARPALTILSWAEQSN